MDKNSIGTVENLRREIGLIQHQEHRYRRHGGHSLAKNLQHIKREFRVLQIRRDQRFGQRIARREWCVPPAVQPSLVGLFAASALCDLFFLTVFRHEKPAP
jgi:hypothetical protein